MKPITNPECVSSSLILFKSVRSLACITIEHEFEHAAHAHGMGTQTPEFVFHKGCPLAFVMCMRSILKFVFYCYA